MDYRFSRINDSSYNDLMHIWESAFGEKADLNFIKQKHNTEYTNKKHIGFIAYSESGEPAAYYGVFAQKLIINNQVFFAAQSGDTMTHKNHTGKGLFTSLAKMTYDLAKEQGVLLVFGFPNANSLPGFVKKLNWTQLPSMDDFVFKIKTLPLAGIARKYKSLNGLYQLWLSLVLVFYKKGKIFQNKSLKENVIVSERSEGYVNYKKYNPNFFLNIDNVNCWLSVDGGLIVGDIEETTTINKYQLFNKLKTFAVLTGCSKLYFSLSKDNPWFDFLKNYTNPIEGIYTGYVVLNEDELNKFTSTRPLQFSFLRADYDTF